MIYPFTHKVLGKIEEPLTYEFDLAVTDPRVWTRWEVKPIKCPAVEKWASQFRDLQFDQLYLSGGVSCHWHIDNSKFFACAGHRILVPLTDNFVWEWKLKDGTIETAVPVIGQIYLINNMIQHRFVSDERRACVFFDLYDTKIGSERIDNTYELFY